MLETEQQRRWWFATHPEYSSSRKGTRTGTHENRGKESSKVSPEAVDAYVDRMLPYEDGPVADLLRSVKKNFGTAANSRKEETNSGASSRDRTDHDSSRIWISRADYHLHPEYVTPRLPTTKELLRWPREMVERFFRWLDAIINNNPLLIDPNALERHHGLPKEFIRYFLDCGLEIEKFIIIMRAADHRLKPKGVHTGKGKGGRWNEEWRRFMRKYPPENTPKHQKRIEKKLRQMMKKYKINEKALLSPRISK